MAYKSRITNKYPGSKFYGSPSTPRTNELSDLVVALKDTAPIFKNIGDTYMEDVKNTATVKMNELFASGKNEKEIQQEILDNKHPELSSIYAQSAIEVQQGKFAAQETVNKIIQNFDSYNRFTVTDEDGNITKEAQSFNDFIKPYIPDLSLQSKYYNNSFAATFGQWKAESEVKDAEIRAEYWTNHKISQASDFIRNRLLTTEDGIDGVIPDLKSFSIELPKIDGKVTQFLTTTESNAVLMRVADGLIKQARTENEIDLALSVLSVDRGTGVGGNQIGSLASTQAEEVNTLINQAFAKRRVILQFDEAQRKREDDKNFRQASLSGIEALVNSDIEGEQAATAIIAKIDGGRYLQSWNTIKSNWNAAQNSTVAMEEIEYDIYSGTIKTYGELIERMAGAEINGTGVAALSKAWANAEGIRENGDVTLVRTYKYKNLYANGLAMVEDTYATTKDMLGRKIDPSGNFERIKMRYEREYTLMLNREIEYFKETNGRDPSPMDAIAITDRINRVLLDRYKNRAEPDEIMSGVDLEEAINTTPNLLDARNAAEFETTIDKVDTQALKEQLNNVLPLLSVDDAGVLNFELPPAVTDENSPTKYLQIRNRETLLNEFNTVLSTLFNNTVTIDNIANVYNSNPNSVIPIFNNLARELELRDGNNDLLTGDQIAQILIGLITQNEEI